MRGDQKDVSPLQGRTVTDNLKRSRRAAVAFLAAAFSFAAVGASAQELFAPKLSINIPTITFSSVQMQNTGSEGGVSGFIDIPWIAQYMKGVYSYGVGIAGLLAGVMIVIGGFYYLTAGGDVTRIQKGKQRITDAVIGLFLVFGAFLLLSTLNPALTSFDALRVQTIRRNAYVAIENTLGTTTADTTNGFGDAPSLGGPAPTAGPAPTGGAHTPYYPSCPVTLTETATSLTAPPGRGRLFKNDPRTRQFFERMAALVAPISDMRERILRVADAAAKCGVHMNSCGSGAGAILSIAGVGHGPGCIDESAGHSCWAQEGSGMRTVSVVPNTSIQYARKAKCGSTDPKCPDNPDCNASGPAAVALVRRQVQSAVPGYPDSFANKLQPGDIMWTYNANASCGGFHSSIFIGWAANGKAQVVQTSDGRPVGSGETCISTRCNGGTNYTPPMWIFRARGL